MVKVVRSTVLNAPIETVWETVRDFNGFDRWHPSIGTSHIERNLPSDVVGCVRKLRLADGAELREQLLSLSDLEQNYHYCLLDTPIPLFNYVAQVQLLPVTDGDATFWHWEGSFTAPADQMAAMTEVVAHGIFETGFAAIRDYLGLEK